MNIWTVDKATIRAGIRQRNTLRKSALLRLLDEQKEFDHACTVIRDQRWHAFSNSKKADYERIREADEVAFMEEIAPDYLAITRQAIEITSPPGEMAVTGNA